MRHTSADTRKRTAHLYGNLFAAYDDEHFRHSMALFVERFRINGFDLRWFKGKTCLDAGCGGGRCAIALSLCGASRVVGIDISRAAVSDAACRAKKMGARTVQFRVASVEKIPFPASSFDFVVCNGVLHHTVHPERVLAEVSRVLKPGGFCYLLVYNLGGVRWPLVQMLRPAAQMLGFSALDACATRARLPVNKRRTYLDDLFVPIIDFYSWERLRDMLARHGFRSIRRWASGRLDHEESVTAYAADMKGLASLFRTASLFFRDAPEPSGLLSREAARLASCAAAYVSTLEKAACRGLISREETRLLAIGDGHHRVLARKAGAART